MAKVRLTRAFYYATEISLRRNRGALHEARDCTAQPWFAPERVKASVAGVLLASDRWHLCRRCRGMK